MYKIKWGGKEKGEEMCHSYTVGFGAPEGPLHINGPVEIYQSFVY